VSALDQHLVNARVDLDGLDRLYGRVHDLAWSPMRSPRYQPSSPGATFAIPIRLTNHRHDDVADGHVPLYATAYRRSAAHLASADTLLADIIVAAGHRSWFALQTSHIQRATAVPAPDFLARLVVHVRRAVDLVAIADQRGLIDRRHVGHAKKALERISVARTALPGIDPPQPKKCRNPRNRSQCDTLPLHHKAKRLCRSCYDHEQYLDRTGKKAG
jgi:hypothetical protein